MRCEQIQQRLADRLTNGAEGLDAPEIARHLEGCAACRQEAAALEQIWSGLGRIPDAAMRDRFADRLAFKARVTDDVVRAEIRKAVVQKQGTFTRREVPSFGQVTKAEKGLIWLLVHQPEDSLEALAALDDVDFEGLAGGRILDLAKKLNEDKGFSPAALLERLTDVDVQLVTAIASEAEAHVRDAHDCGRILKRLRWERERAAIQREIDRLQEVGALEGEKLQELLVRKYDVIQRIEALI